MISKKLLFGLMITVLLLLAACHKFTGGGWFDGMNGGKATFSFVAQCEDTDEGVVVLGDFQFDDKSARVRFHGEFEYYYLGVVESCHHLAESLPDLAQLVGTCKTQPGNVEGWFNVIVSDQNGRLDYIAVNTNCTPDGTEYFNGGILRGGNITSHKG